MNNLLQSLSHSAPDLPEYKAQYRAIQFEPVAHSGERLTIGIMAKSENGDIRVIQTIPNQVIRCMYGKKKQQMNNLITLTLDAARCHLKANKEIADWTPPISGVTLPEIQTTYSNTEMEGILFQAINHHASLYRGDIIESVLSEWSDEENQGEEQSSERVLIQIRKYVNNKKPALEKNWNRTVLTEKGTQIQIDYLGAYYNAGFANFNVKQKKTAYQFAKAKLYDLELLRDKRGNEVIKSQQSFELLVNVSKVKLSDEQDYLGNLESAADEQGLRVITHDQPLFLANRILQMEAA